MAVDATRWHARAQQVFVDAGFCDSEGVVGTSDVWIDYPDPGTAFGKLLQEAWDEEGVEPFKGIAGSVPSSAAPPPPPPPPLASTRRCLS